MGGSIRCEICIRNAKDTEGKKGEKKSTQNDIRLSWEKLGSYVLSVGDKLQQTPQSGGFVPDIIVGISNGGIIIADMLSRFFAGKIPVQCLWVDRYSQLGKITFSPPQDRINENLLKTLSQKKFKDILIVDDISRTGKTMIGAEKFLNSKLKSKEIKTSVIVKYKKSKFSPDFYAVEVSECIMPFSLFGGH